MIRSFAGVPTAAEHRAEAGSLDGVLDTLRAARSDLVHDRDDVGVRGGSTSVVRAAIGASSADLDELGRIVALVVDELHRRAVLCDVYSTELVRHQSAHRRWEAALHRYRATAGTDLAAAWPGPEPMPPAVPFVGAVAG